MSEPIPNGYSIRSIPTTYRGTEFKSRLEAHYAKTFDGLDWPWKYEHHHIETPHGAYVPDFAVSKFGYVEVKHENYIPTENDVLRWDFVRQRSVLAVVYGEWSGINAYRMGHCAYLADRHPEMIRRILEETRRLRDVESDPDPFVSISTSRRCISCNRTRGTRGPGDWVQMCDVCGEEMATANIPVRNRGITTNPRVITTTKPRVVTTTTRRIVTTKKGN